MPEILYFDAFSGVSGDMTVGALLHLGMPLEYLREQLDRLALPGYRLEVRPTEQHHISGLKFEVVLEEPEQHVHRSLSDILKLIAAAGLPARVQARAGAVFRALAGAEGRIHNISPEEVHFHEVGAVDAIVDIVGACIGFEYYDIEEFYCGPLPAGSGFVKAAHGLLPVPAPATLELLAQAGATLAPAVSLPGGVEYPARSEMITPTGAALVATLCKMERPALTLRAAGYGFGSKEFAWPNALRLWLGQRSPDGSGRAGSPRKIETNPSTGHNQAGASHFHHDHNHDHAHPHTHDHLQPEAESTDQTGIDSVPSPATSGAGNGKYEQDEVSLIETNLDDMTAEALGFLMERLLAAGALDVYFSPVQMKKNRPAVKLSVLARPAGEAALAGLILAESSSFGVRCARFERYMAGRSFATVDTPAGPAQVKLKYLDGVAVEAVPEYESVAELARRSGRPWREIYEEARQAGQALISGKS